MTNEEKLIKEGEEERGREKQAQLAKLRGQSPNQRRLFEKMGMVVKVSKPADEGDPKS